MSRHATWAAAIVVNVCCLLATWMWEPKLWWVIPAALGGWSAGWACDQIDRWARPERKAKR